MTLLPVTNWDTGQPNATYDTGLFWDQPPPPTVIGTAPDMINRLLAVLPPWFGNAATPVLTPILSGFASVAASVYCLITYVTAQTRIATATDGFLDLIALDFFGRRIQRFAGEIDDAFRARIRKEIFRQRNTVAAIRQMLIDITGRPPVIVEPGMINACGYGIAGGYGVAGAYGSLSYPGQVFVTAFRPFQGSGVPMGDGYGASIGGYGIGAIQYGAQPQTSGIATDADIYAAVDSVKLAGVIAWVAIES
jgi:hypothetical protein